MFPDSKRVNTKISLQNISFWSLWSNKSAHYMKICLTEITALHATQTGTPAFLRIKECVKYKWPICSLFQTVFSFLLLQKDNRPSESFGKTLWNTLVTKINLTHSLCQIWYTYLAVRGFRSKKGMSSAIGFSSRTSFAASLRQIPTCPGTHIKTISFWSALLFI